MTSLIVNEQSLINGDGVNGVLTVIDDYLIINDHQVVDTNRRFVVSVTVGDRG